MEHVDYKKRFINLRNRYILLAIFIASMIITALVVVNSLISSAIEKENTIGSVINVSGKQRMLSQHIAKLSLLINNGGPPELLSAMDSALLLFEQSHNTLLNYNDSLQLVEMTKKFEVLQPNFEALHAAGVAFVANPSVEGCAQIIELESIFLPMMDSMVAEYDMLSARGYMAITKNVSLSNYAIILLVILAAILTYVVAIRIVKNYSIQLSKQSAELREAQVELEKSKMKEQFAYIASHDLQEPVRSIISLSELLESSHSDKMNTEGKEILLFIKESGNRMTRLIKGLLDYSRLGKNQELEKIEVSSVIEDIKKDLQKQILDKGAVIKYSKLPVIVGYRLDINSIFQNLISNAIKFSRQSETLNVNISFTEDNQYWRFQVEDNGIGLEARNSEKIFQLFQRLHERKKFEGAGIGLAHCKRIAEIHRGDITVESQIGIGSKFKFSVSKELI